MHVLLLTLACVQAKPAQNVPRVFIANRVQIVSRVRQADPTQAVMAKQWGRLHFQLAKQTSRASLVTLCL